MLKPNVSGTATDVVLISQHGARLVHHYLGCTAVANEGFVLYIGGDYSLHLKCWVTCTICQQTSCHINTWDDNVTLDMRTRNRPADWCAAVRSLSADGKPVQRIWQLALSSHQERTYSRKLRVNRGYMWNVKSDVLRCMSQKKGLVNIYM